ncbi:hypothetical protein J7S99_13905 [Providencia rettgeri]|uniref:P-loop NTPase fold protein n=1 Tax=Providencia rettgeri TaxID=587 RepID=UPI001B35D622|nr:P-loop NTPase fold protein [Providencia rettgeri]MBQ0398688.1 hypothetical protein [Providencia rettgeri]
MKNELAIEQLNERLANFCNSDSSNDHVLLLNGEWGIGKSYLLKISLAKKIEIITAISLVYLV